MYIVDIGEVKHDVRLLAPKASEASWGLSYFKPGVPSGYCCVCESGYCNRVCYMGVFRKVANLGAGVTLFEAVGYC